MKKITLRPSLFLIFLSIFITQVSEVPAAQAMKRGASASSGDAVERDEASHSPRKKMTFTVRSPLYDTTFKRAFMQPGCMIELLNSIYDFQGPKRITEVEYLTQEFPGRVEGARNFIFDLHCRAASGETFIVEMQKKSFRGMTKRLELYSAAALRHQWDVYTSKLVSGSKDAAHSNRFEGLEPIYTLALLDYEDEILRSNASAGFIHPYKILHTKTGQNDFPLQQWTLVDLAGLRKALTQGSEGREIPEHFRTWSQFLTVRDQSTVEVEGEETDPLIMAYRAVSNLTPDDQYIIDKEEMDLATAQAILESAIDQAVTQAVDKAVTQAVGQAEYKGKLKLYKSLLSLLDREKITETEFLEELKNAEKNPQEEEK